MCRRNPLPSSGQLTHQLWEWSQRHSSLLVKVCLQNLRQAAARHSHTVFRGLSLTTYTHSMATVEEPVHYLTNRRSSDVIVALWALTQTEGSSSSKGKCCLYLDINALHVCICCEQLFRRKQCISKISSLAGYHDWKHATSGSSD